MSGESPTVFDSADVFLLRAPVLPSSSEPAYAGLSDSGIVAAAADDPLMREALLLSSPTLARAVDEAAAGRRARPAQLRRLALSLLRYRLRMSRRATPFGLLAGSTVGAFGGGRPTAALTGGRHKRVQPDLAWLGALLDMRDTTAPPDGLKVVLNNICHRQGNRLVLPVTSRADGSVRRTVQLTGPVESVVRRARRALPFGDLAAAVVAGHPSLTPGAAAALVTRLIALEFLLTESMPSPAAADAPARLALTAPDSAGLRATADSFREYAAREAGRGDRELAAVHRAAGSPQSVRVDLAVDAEVRLPRDVAREAERAASVLWRTSVSETDEQHALRAYHREFLERYGLGERVPLAELLTPDSGLGPPAGYLLPPGHRPSVTAPHDPVRAAALNSLYADALMRGETAIELDDAAVGSLEAVHARPAPPSADVPFSIVADSLDDLTAGRYLLEVVPFREARPAGTMWGRFSRLLDAEEQLTAFHRRTAEGMRGQTADRRADAPLPVRVDYAPRDRRLLNITAAPDPAGPSGRRIAVGLYADLAAPGNIDLAEVLVHADTQRFHLTDAATRRRLAPFVPHMLNPALAPNMARFLLEAPLMEMTPLRAWDWGHLAGSPFLPAVRHGRAVLSPATWRLRGEDLEDGDGGGDRALESWRDRWRVPDRVRLARADQRLALDLRLRRHRDLLCKQVESEGLGVLHEDLAPVAPAGWLCGPDGVYDAELVVPLFARVPARRSVSGSAGAGGNGRTPPPRTPAPPLRPTVAHLPGGEWLSVHIPSSADGQALLLASHLGPWLNTVSGHVDRWFFLRYGDLATGRPHLRLRLHGDPGALNRHVLPALGDWVRDLTAGSVADGMSLHPYRPEIERYGGAAAMGAAERFFRADSALVLARLADSPETDPLPVARDVARLVRGFHEAGGAGRDDWERWLLARYAKDEERHRVFTRQRGEALAAVFDGGHSDDGLDWSAALAAYSAEVHRAARREGWVDAGTVLAALMHMHCNRRLRFGGGLEPDVYAIARGAVAARRARRTSVANDR